MHMYSQYQVSTFELLLTSGYRVNKDDKAATSFLAGVCSMHPVPICIQDTLLLLYIGEFQKQPSH